MRIQCVRNLMPRGNVDLPIRCNPPAGRRRHRGGARPCATAPLRGRPPPRSGGPAPETPGRHAAGSFFKGTLCFQAGSIGFAWGRDEEPRGKRGHEIMMREKNLFWNAPVREGYAGSSETRLRCGKIFFDGDLTNHEIIEAATKWIDCSGGRVSSRAANTAAGDSRPPSGIDTIN